MKETKLQQVARAIMVSRGGCKVIDWNESNWNPNVEQALKEAQASIDAIEKFYQTTLLTDKTNL